MRIMVVALWALLAFGFIQGASAQNGLQRFESDLKPQLGFKSFTYGSATAQGPSGFVLNNVVAVTPATPATGDKETTVKIDKVTVEALDFDRLKKDLSPELAPRFAKLAFQGIVGDDDAFAMLAPYGISKAPVDLALDYLIDPDKKVLTISKLEVNLRGQSRMTLALIMDGVDDKMSQVETAKDDGRLRTATLEIVDTGLLAKVLPAIAKEQGTTAEALVAVTVGPIAAFATGQGSPTLKALDGVVSFITDWKQAKGPIKIAITPAKTAGMADLEKVMEPNGLTNVLGLTVDYTGTRAGAATAGQQAAAPAPAAPPAAAAAKTLNAGEAWLTVVGNTLTGKVDGEVLYEYYRKDGTLTLMEGSELTKGKWTLEGEKVCFKYPDEDKDCQTISRTGDEVTLTNAKGKGLRLKVLPGNPKNL
ncbi:MAG TPA: hypothetical protein VK634_18890 [Reyranella sp.]|nr:hypothetical protein [Reyranella sp.]